MPEYLTPGVYFEFRDAATPLRGVRTDIAGFVGLAERGPLDAPVRIDSWRQFQAQFGSYVPYGFLAYAVKGFFENEGRTCFVVRVAGETAARASRVLKNKNGDDVIVISARNEGVWGHKIGFSLRTHPSPTGDEFSLVLMHNGVARESFPRLSLDASAPRYFARIVNEGDELRARSQWIAIEVVAGLPPGTDLLPDAAQSGLKNGGGFLTGGKDGIASLTRHDFLGDAAPLAEPKKGLSALERVDAISIVCIPDIHIQPVLVLPPPPPEEPPPHDPCLPFVAQLPLPVPLPGDSPEQPPVFSEDDVLTVQRALIEHCERMKDRVAILDAPVRPGGAPLTIAALQQWRSNFDTPRGFAALYYPWIKVTDPLRLDNRPVRAIPTAGHVAGLYARTDLTVGVHKAPANAELLRAEDVTVSVDDEVQGVLNPLGINCVRAFPGRGLRVYGARTLSSDADWRYVNVRRLMLSIEETVDEAMQWTVFEPNDFNLRLTIVVSINTFLEEVWRAGALTGNTPEEAFFVKCDETNNPPEVIELGRLIVEIGVAPTHPAEFVVFRIGRTVEELEIVER